MCGHAVIALGKYAVDMGLVSVVEGGVGAASALSPWLLAGMRRPCSPVCVLWQSRFGQCVCRRVFLCIWGAFAIVRRCFRMAGVDSVDFSIVRFP